MAKPYRILSFDGGGIRGIYTAKLLSMLEREKPFLSNVDLFVGTSTGAILALTLASGFHPDDVVELYKNFGKVIFVPSEGQPDAGGTIPKYQNAYLKNLVSEHVFPNSPKMSDLRKKALIPAFKLYDKNKGRWTPYCFHNITESSEDPFLVDVMLASGAAPIYFPSYQGYIDGGVFANNPSMLGACKALDLESSLTDIKDISLLSLGTGDVPNFINKEADFGSMGWFVNSPKAVPDHAFFSIVSDGINDVPHYMCKQTLQNYHRVNTSHKVSIALDEYEKVPELLEEAERVPKDYKDLWENSLAFVEEKFCS